MSHGPRLKHVVVVGVHRFETSADEFTKAVESQWGAGLRGEELAEARMRTWKHFADLRLIEVRIEPADAHFDWGDFVQSADDLPEDEWQVAYDEQPLDEQAGRWIFFLHFVDHSRPLTTPVGQHTLPAPTPLPHHLRNVAYHLP